LNDTNSNNTALNNTALNNTNSNTTNSNTTNSNTTNSNNSAADRAEGNASSEATADVVDRLWSHEQIRQLAYRYAVATDSRDIEALVELFVDDVKVGKSGVGRDALRADFVQQLRSIGTSILHVTNHVIEVSDTDTNAATGIVYCRGEVEQNGQWIIQAIQYRDTYSRRDGRWYFVRRKHLLWYGADVLTRPVDLPAADYRTGKWGKGELPEWFPTWGPFWDHEHDKPTSAST
jgi:ketosteroid isomerase-like protein